MPLIGFPHTMENNEKENESLIASGDRDFIGQIIMTDRFVTITALIA